MSSSFGATCIDTDTLASGTALVQELRGGPAAEKPLRRETVVQGHSLTPRPAWALSAISRAPDSNFRQSYAPPYQRAPAGRQWLTLFGAPISGPTKGCGLAQILIMYSDLWLFINFCEEDSAPIESSLMGCVGNYSAGL
jgi:hypothetical protein